MNSILHVPSAVRVTPTLLTEGAEPVPNQYSIEITYKPDMPAQRFHRVHASTAAATALCDPALSSVHLVMLKIGSPEQRVLPNRPSQVVLGVELKNGEKVMAVPREWMLLRRRSFLLGIALVVIAMSAIACNPGVIVNAVAAGALVIGAFSISRARSIHAKPFWVNEGWGNLEETLDT